MKSKSSLKRCAGCIRHMWFRRIKTLKDAAALVKESRFTVMTGMATSEYASYAASSQINRAGKLNFVYDASELLHYHLPTLFHPGACLVLVSQSGSSAEIVHILDEVKGKVPIIGVFNDETSPLAMQCDIPLPIFSGPQLACGSKTNLSSVAVLNLLASAVCGENLQQDGASLLAAADGVQHFLEDWSLRSSRWWISWMALPIRFSWDADLAAPRRCSQPPCSGKFPRSSQKG